jgi:predicted DNA-binding antitoxin AbrB/MazE fold protein
MTKIVDAVFEGGVFKPKQPVELDDKTEVRLLIQPVVKRDEAIRLVTEWMHGDALEQKDTWAYLKQAIDEDRPSYRKLFES